jgi:L-lactate dehydrogenase complex protein LldG
MNNERDLILGRVKAALAPLEQRAGLPEYDGDLAVIRRFLADRDPFAVFSERLRLLNGEVADNPAALVQRLRDGNWLSGYCDPSLWPWMQPFFGGEFSVETDFDRARIDDYDFGITRGDGAIAETGTIILKDHTTSRRLAALAPWVHVAVLPRRSLFPDLVAALAALGDDPNVIWCTGPSKTADVEGVLIEGVHGPGIQIALFRE